MITIENLEKELKSGELTSFYLFYGEEQFLLESSLKKIKTLFGNSIKGINDIAIDDTNVMHLVSELETPAFGYEKKIIVVKNSGLLKKDGRRKNVEMTSVRDKLLEYLEENKEVLKESVVLVVVEDEVDTKLSLYQWFEKHATTCRFDFQKPMQIGRRMKAICHAYQVKIEDSTLHYFMECCGTNMQDLINEIRKLIEYAAEGGTIEKKDVDALCVKKLESVIFDLTDNLGKRKISIALDVLQNLIYAKEPLQKILVTLYNHFKKLYLTKLAGKENLDIISSLGLKPNQTFLVNKYKMQAGYFKEEELRHILQDLTDLDYHYKNGLIDLQIGMETILCQYCG